MRIAVAQHASPTGEAAIVVPVVRGALERGADLVICPAVPVFAADELSTELDRVVGESAAVYVLPVAEDAPHGTLTVIEPEGGVGGVGRIAVLVGDACFDRATWERARDAGVAAAILCPLSESELQAEAALEIAIALSDSLCGLVVVAEAAGADAGDPGHGGSAIVVLGDVAAEGFGETDVVMAELTVPVTGPEPPESFPHLPTLLAQRVAHHKGERLNVEWPADLSEGGGGAR